MNNRKVSGRIQRSSVKHLIAGGDKESRAESEGRKASRTGAVGLARLGVGVRGVAVRAVTVALLFRIFFKKSLLQQQKEKSQCPKFEKTTSLKIAFAEII